MGASLETMVSSDVRAAHSPGAVMRLRDLLLGTVAAVAILVAGPVSAQAPAVEVVPATPAQPAPQAAESLRIRSGDHDGFSRLLFTYGTRVDYQVSRDGDVVTVTFARPDRADASHVATVRPARVQGLTQQVSDGRLVVRMRVPPGATLRDSRVGTNVVIDVVDAPRTAQAAAPARSTTPPAPAPALAPAPAGQRGGLPTQEQVTASVAATAAQLAQLTGTIPANGAPPATAAPPSASQSAVPPPPSPQTTPQPSPQPSPKPTAPLPPSPITTPGSTITSSSMRTFAAT
jgi:hypothetical protein